MGSFFRRIRLFLGLLALASFARTASVSADEAPILRVFLKDGTTIASYGEYTRLGDRVVFSLPLGARDGTPHLQLVSVPVSQVDWPRTERYRDSARAARYAATRGEQDFTRMTGEVAATLHDITRTAEPLRRLELAEKARARLAAWGSEHYGYRVREVREIAGLLEETITELRAAAGRRDFDLNFVAIVEPSLPARLLPDPTRAESIAQLLALVDLADGPSERIALLERALQLLDSSKGQVNDASLRAARTVAARRLERERAADRDYARLIRDMTTLGAARAARGDVRGLESLMSRLERQDRRLGHQRPQLVAAIASTLGHDLQEARRLRLAYDQWRLRRSTYQSYERLVRVPLDELVASRAALEDIRQLAGPDAETLLAVRNRTEVAMRGLQRIIPPEGMSEVHELLQSACRMAETAVRVRQEAVARGSLEHAWSASAAAAGAQLLSTRATGELKRLMAPPRVR